jgi:hypothetical protein
LALRQIFEPHARRRGLPILHLNGFKIANPTVLARISHEELTELLHSSKSKEIERPTRFPNRDAELNGSFLGPTPT